MKRLLHITAIIFILWSPNNSFATTTTATMSGLWTEAIWDNGIPGCYDSIVIPAGIIVTVTTNIDLTACPDSVQLHIYGRLEFTNGSRLQLPCGSDVYIHAGGSMGKADPGGGSSTYLEICNDKVWTAADGEQTGPTTFCEGGCPPLTPLPITLLSFSAEYNSTTRSVDLYWSTASETDNDYFTVEKSSDGINWEVVTTTNGTGNSSIAIEYHEKDKKPFLGRSYYRLKQTDFNGEYNYSPIVELDREAEGISVYPNPVVVGDEFYIYSEELLESYDFIQLYSPSGQLIKSLSTQDYNGNNLVLSTVGLQRGVYLLKMNDQILKLSIQ